VIVHGDVRSNPTWACYEYIGLNALQFVHELQINIAKLSSRNLASWPLQVLEHFPEPEEYAQAI